MTSQQQQQQQDEEKAPAAAIVQSDRSSRPKSKPKKEMATTTITSTSTSTSTNSNKQQATGCTPPFDYLVPMNICVRSAPNQQQQQPQVDEQPVVECISWALFNRLSGKIESSWSLRVTTPSKEANTTQDGCSLSEAIQQVDKSLVDKNCALVTCGPVPLRQHLHPIAKRLKVELSEHFSQYVDLLKEFDRCTFANNLTGRQVARANGLVAPATCPCWPTCEPSSSSSSSSPPSGCGEKENSQRQRVTSSGHQQASDGSAATPAVQQPQQQPQPAPISQGSRKRFEEILKFLSINLETGKSKPVCPATLAGKQCNCLACSQALVEASCSIVERLLREGHSFNRLERIKRRVEVGLCETSAHEAEQRVVRARGLPWQASEQDIADFFTGLNIAKGGVGLCLSRQGRRNGEALIQFESREHRNLALSRHKHFMGNRYIEVYRASGDDFQSVAAGYNNKAEAFISKGAQFIVRMRGLPFTCTAKQVVDFFASSDTKTKPCEVFAGEEGVMFVRNQDEKPTGDAFVLFATDEYTRRAIAKHHQNIGTRYVELFRSTVSEVQQVLSVSTGPNSSDEQAPVSSVSGKQQNANATRSKQQAATMSEKNKSATVSKSPVPKSNGGSYTNQLDSKSAFPALSEKPIAWQRPDAATYAQRLRLTLAEESPSRSEQQSDQKTSDSNDIGKSSVVVGGDQKCGQIDDPKRAREHVVSQNNGRHESGCSDVVEQVGLAESDGNSSQAQTEAMTNASDKLDLATNDETSSGPPSTPQSPGSCSASSSGLAPMATPNLVRSPISSLSSSADDSSSSNLSYKQTNTHSHYYNNNQHNNYHAGSRRHHQNHNYQHQHGRSSTRYQQNYIYHTPAPMMSQQQHQALMYNQELIQTSMQQQHPASLAQTPYSTPHYQMAYATTQSQSMAGTFDQSHQLSHQQQPPPPPPPYTANSMHQHQGAQQVYATAAAAAASASDPALMSRRDCIRLRGLPFEAQIDDVLHFLGKHSENILYQGVHMVYSAQGQPTGEAIIQMSSIQAASTAAQEAHRRVMSVGKKQRYIEVIPSSIDDLKPTLGYGLAAFAASRAAATAAYGMHPMHYAAYAAAAAGGPQMGPIDPITGYPMQHQHMPYMDQSADCYSVASGDQTATAPVASVSSATSETGVSPTPEQNSVLSSKQASESEATSEETDPLPGTPKPAPSEEQNTIQEAKETQMGPTNVSSAIMSSANNTQPITTTATSSSHSMQQQQQQQHHMQQQQQQALMAAAQAAAYYPILYYYPPPQQQHQPILATAAPTANRYH